MKLNHLNLTVTDVSTAQIFLETYFGLRRMEGGNVNMVGLLDDDGFVLTLMKAGHSTNVMYPTSFHIGFTQTSEAQVNEINRRLKDDGYDVKSPQRLHGAWAFYFQAPGGFEVEVSSY
jgi:lactoylglutathione lyase